MHGHLFLRICVISVLFILSLSSPSYSQQKELKEAEILNQQMVRLFQQGKYAEAIPFAEKVHSIKQKALGPDHPEVAQSLNNLAELNRYQGDYPIAERLFKEALAIAEKALGPGHAGVRIILNNLAGLYELQGDSTKAQAIREKILKRFSSEGPLVTGEKESSNGTSTTPGGFVSIGKLLHDRKTPVHGSQNRKRIETAGTIENKISYPYSLKLASYRTLERVGKALARYREKGISPYWVRVDLKAKGVWYRIFTGYFRDRKDAETYKQKHGLSKSIVSRTEYANLIGTYTSPHELEDKMVSLKRLGYLPYVIRDPNGGSRLLVGAFFTKREAEETREELKANRVKCKLIKR